MGIHRNVDDWFLGYKTRSGKAKSDGGLYFGSGHPKHPFLRETLRTRGIVLEQYGQIAKELYKMGHKTKARIIGKLAKEVAGQSFDTKAQSRYDRIHDKDRRARKIRASAGGNGEKTRRWYFSLTYRFIFFNRTFLVYIVLNC
ncbi:MULTISPECIES: hypothetical protein [Neisseria]|uniref:TraS family protein n=1 Tax=Neisseria musculi TaxID=1815583 RepID=A0A7H1MFI7_9NEIS|nr:MULTISPECIES: hypothetical protein [Neisseria]QNT60402.1 traS family protein [Neisseria musculi]